MKANDPFRLEETVSFGRSLSADEQIRLWGQLEMVLRDEHGHVKDRRVIPNLVTTAGKAAIIEQLVAAPAITKPTHLAVGTSTTAAVVGDTALIAEIARAAFSSKTRSTNVLTMVATFAAGTGTGAITEAGILNNTTGGDLYSRSVFSVINKAAGDSLQSTWTYTYP